MQYVYEPAAFISGWFDGEGGLVPLSWWDRDLTSTNGVLVNLNILEPMFVDDDDVFLVMPPITVELTAGYFEDEDLIFVPMSVRALDAPDQMLKNEVRRIR